MEEMWRRVETGLGEGENIPQSQCHGMGMHLLQWRSHTYISILEDNIWPVIVGHFPGNDYLFQDENVPIHRACSTKEYVARTHLKNMSWLAQSSHLNVIENIWLYIKRKLEVLIHKINSNSDLFRESFCILQTIPLTYIRNFYDSIPRRILNVIRLKGHSTKY